MVPGLSAPHLCRHLITNTEAAVVVVDKLTYAANLSSLAPIADDPRYTFVKADIADRQAMNDVFATHKPDAVMHLAAESHVDRSITGSDAFIQTNIVGTYTLLETAAPIGAVVLRKSATVSGFCTFRRTRFTAVSAPRDCSARTRPTIPPRPIRPQRRHQIISPSHGSAPTAAGRRVELLEQLWSLPLPGKLIPLIILNGLDGRELPVYGDGSNIPRLALC